MMKKIVDVIKLGESVGRKLSDNATETDKRRISDWDETASDKEKVLEKLSDPDYIQEKTLYYKSFDIAGAWKRAKVRKLAQQKSMHSKMRKLVWGAAATVAVLLRVTVYLFQQDDIVKENVEVHQAIANILPGRGVPVLYLDDNRQIALNADTLDIEGTRGIEVGKKMITYSKDQIGKEEKYNKIVVPKGGEFHLVLADGSEIWLNAESTLQYFVHDIAKERVVYLQGEAYFKIAKNEQRPFKIISGEHEVKVLGTEFNVNAYLGAPMIYTTLIEGKVNVGVVNRPDIGQVLQKNGRQSVYNQNNKSISLRHVDPRIYTAWKDGYFIFRYSTLREVMQQLSRWYDFEYEVPDMLLDKYHFSGEFKRFDNLDRVLEIIRSTGIPFVLDIKNGKVIIREEA